MVLVSVGEVFYMISFTFPNAATNPWCLFENVLFYPQLISSIVIGLKNSYFH